MDVQETPALIPAQDEAQAHSTPAATGDTNPTPRGRWYGVLLPWWQAAMAVMPIFLTTRFIFLLLTYFGSVLFTVNNSWHLGPTAPWYAPVVAMKAMLHFSPFTF